MKKWMIVTGTVALALVLALALAPTASAEGGDPGPPSGSGVQPIWVDGNPDCGSLGYDFGYKIEPPTSGTYDGFTITTADGVYFDWLSELGVDAVIVKGGSNANVYVYDPPQEAFSDTGLHAPINPQNQRPYGLSHIEFCYDYELDVEKDAATTFTRTYEWDITKAVDPAEHTGFAGDEFTSGYDVAVSKTGYTDSDWAVSGSITIENNTPLDATITGVTDVVSPAIAATVDCGVTFPYVLASGADLTCTYSTALPDGTARTNTATVTTSGIVHGDTATADVIFGDPTTEVNATINVTDYFDGDLVGEALGSASGDYTFEYDRTFECPTDASLYIDGVYTGSFPNYAEIDETGQQDDANVDLTCYAPVVTKTADEFFTRTWDWTIVKDYDGDYDLLAGGSVDHGYKVSVTPTSTDNGWQVTGSITITNPNPGADMALTSVTDVAGGVAAGVTCPSLTVPAGGQLVCTYDTGAQDSPGSNPFGDTNVATAVFAGANWVGTAEIVFPTEPTSEVDPVITVDDDNLEGEAWSADRAYAEWTYTKTFDCSADPADYSGGTYSYSHLNTATINETDDSDTATVDVTCYAPVVTKTADEFFTRSWDWTIDKSADQSALTLSVGQQFLVNYSVTVETTGYSDNGWQVTGSITITNSHPSEDMLLTSVTDVAGGIAAEVTCPSLTVPANGQLVCTYETAVQDSADLNPFGPTNTATAVFAEASWTGTAGIDFSGGPTEQIDECVNVTDTLGGDLGTVCAGDAPHTFAYSYTVGPYDACGDYTVDNTASFVTNDTGATGSDNWTVNVNVPCAGCTLTPGYWKTHSQEGPAPYDDTWALLNPAQEDFEFFLSGQTYYEVLWTAPQGGNAYYILAHAYIAAELNFLNGADPSAAQAAFDAATALFETYTPAEIAGMKGKSGNELRQQFIGLAYILDQYNNGYIGPGHCSD